MTEKILAAFQAMRDEISELRAQIEGLPVAADGRDGRDGSTPDIEDIIAQIPAPADPEPIDTGALVADVLSRLPEPRDGRDAPPVSVADVAAVVHARMPAPEAAEPGAPGAAGTQGAQGKAGRDGKDGKAGRNGRDGKDGESITSVSLDKNELIVAINGKRRKIGRIAVPTPSAPFSPGNGGGGAQGAPVVQPYGSMQIEKRDSGDPDPYTVAVLAHPSGNDTMNPPLTPQVAGPGPFGGFYKVAAYASNPPLHQISVDGAAIVIEIGGDYVVPGGWITFRHSANGATVTFALAIERAGQLLFAPSPVPNSQANNNKATTTTATGIFSVLAGDKLSMWAASDIAGTVTVGNSIVGLHRLADT